MIERALKLTREFHRMKQVELAEQLHISTSYLSEIEAGKKPPSLELLEAYSRIFKVPASTFLLFGEKAAGKGRNSRVNAERLLKFFEWVLSDEDEQDGRDAKETPQAREAKEAIRIGSMRTVRN